MKRIWLIGSGRSLAKTPMDELIGEDVMVMNKYGFISDRYGWKLIPKYYFKIDINTVDMTYPQEIRWAVERGCHLFLWDQLRTGYPPGSSVHHILPVAMGDLPNTTWIKKCEHTPYQYDNYKAVQSWHLPELCTAYGGMSTMIQLGVLLGYDEIYLLGCDLGYTPDHTGNHAIPDYTKDSRDKSQMDNGNMLALHRMAARCSPIPIYNATYGGYLEVYPRADMLAVLKKERRRKSNDQRKSRT